MVRDGQENHFPLPLSRQAYIHTYIHTYKHTCNLIDYSGSGTLYDALLTAREVVREKWERYDSLYIDSHAPIHTYSSV